MSIREHDSVEQRRLKLQATLDSTRSQEQRNKLGQFATPTALATHMLRLARSLMSSNQAIRFLDPAFGTGAFYSALLRCFPGPRIESAAGYEIDPHYAKGAAKLWKGTALRLVVDDFTKAQPPAGEQEKATLVVCNPPYVRHHHLDADLKRRLRLASAEASAVDLNGLTGLYCYFLSLTHAWMARDALAVWLIPSEFMDVNYGRPLKEYLLNRVTLLRIHRFDPGQVQFGDALVSSAVVCFRNASPAAEHVVTFTYGGTLAKPQRTRELLARDLSPKSKWTRLAFEPQGPDQDGSKPKLSDLFSIKRGIATGANDFFILTEAKAKGLRLPARFLKPILPGPRFLPTDRVKADENGRPLLDRRLVLLDCHLPESEVRIRHPSLWDYLKSGAAQGIHKRYLCRHRSPWYSQEERDPAPLLCTYMGRVGRDKGAFRFILNHSKAIAANVYLMLYPKAVLARMLSSKSWSLEAIWSALRRIPWDVLISAGRVYGGGLHKLEPKELAEVPLDSVLGVLPEAIVARGRQLSRSW